MTRRRNVNRSWPTGAFGLIAAMAVGALGCSSSSPAAGPGAGGATGTAQLPPAGAAAVEAWLQTGQYKSWHCESAVHAARSPSPHGFNRICSNTVVSAHAADAAAWPQGAAAVKELYATATDTTPAGYAVYAKTAADSAAGANWYWYERVPLDNPAPHDAAGVVADGPGSSGPAQQICVGCHGAAGSDAAHTPSVGSHDQIYTPVP